MPLLTRREFLGAAAALGVAPAGGHAWAWRAGAAAVDITPAASMPMAGFAARTSPSRGVALPLYARALALEDRRGRRAVLVGLDLLGVTAPITARVAAQVERRFRVPRAALLLNSSHTHCGPIVDSMLSVAYDLTPSQWQAVRSYTAQLESRILEVIGRALGRLEPARLGTAEGRATFGANRRAQFTPDGPADPRVPVLRVEGRRGLLAMVVAYACHNTTLRHEFVEFHGDYAGVAMAALERRHPGLTAIFVSGCGADINPDPRGTLALAQQHGHTLAAAAEKAAPGAPLEPLLETAFTIVDLPFAPTLTPAQWQERFGIPEVYARRHAALLRELAEGGGSVPAAQAQPVQVWRLGGLVVVALGGEVVVDYALRLAREHPRERLWALGYSNDVFGYVPSRRVLNEGGYEGGGAMLYYGRPAPLADGVEERVFETIDSLLREG